MAHDNPQNQAARLTISEESDLTLEVVILLVFGVFMLLFGLLLFRIHSGDLPYNPDSMYGLFLVIVALQIITMGKTPFGDLRRSWMVVIIGICMAVVGMSACFLPGLLTGLVRELVGIILFAGGTVLLLQLFIAKGKAKTWTRSPGILRQLTLACFLVYLMTIISGLVTLLPGITTNPQTAILLIIYGISFFYLAWCIQKVSRLYPRKEETNPASGTVNSENDGVKGIFLFFRDASLPLMVALLLLLGVLLVFLGILLVPVNLGLLPFSPDGQLGLLLVITAIQMLALGNTPVGKYRRSWLLMLIGIVFVAMGIVSCIVPGILTNVIRILLGVLNITGGVILLLMQVLPVLHAMRDPSTGPVPPVHPITRKLEVTQVALNLVAITFGLTVLVPGLVSGQVISGILVLNGLLLFVLAYLLQQISKDATG